MDNQKTKRRLASYRSLRLEVDNQLDRLARLRNEEQLPAMRERVTNALTAQSQSVRCRAVFL